MPQSVARSRRSSTSGAGTAGGASNRSYRWAELMKRAFEVDVLVCECGARREVISCITDRAVVRRILGHLGLPAEPLASTPPRAAPILDFGTRVTG